MKCNQKLCGNADDANSGIGVARQVAQDRREGNFAKRPVAKARHEEVHTNEDSICKVEDRIKLNTFPHVLLNGGKNSVAAKR